MFRFPALATPLALLLLSSAPLIAQAPALHPDTVAAVDRIFARYSASTPGCAVGVARGGHEILARGYGLAELEHGVPIAPSTVFEAGSVSKQFTAFLLLLLEQEGRLSLDDPLRAHLPELPDYGAPLTIAHVLSHTSGLRDWFGIASVQGAPAGERHYSNEDLLEIARKQRALNFPSGTEYLYSNTGWNLLALVVERVTGESLQEAARRRIFEPLGMHATRWRDDVRAVVPRRAPAYARADGRWVHAMPFMSAIGAGGLLTTVHDLLRWNENLSTGRVGGRALVERMQTRARLADGRPIGYGLGLMIREAHGTRAITHGGSTGGYRAQVARYPERGLSIAILCNEAGATAADANAVAAVFLGRTDTPRAAVLPTAEVAAIRGRYRDVRTGAPLEILLRDGRPAFGGYTLHVVRRDAGRAAVLRGVDADGDTLVAERVAEWTPRSGELREYVGTYHSSEAEATWEVVPSGDSLVLQGPRRRRVPLRPAYQDVFTAPGIGAVAFRRDAAGRVGAMSFLMGRIRDLRFERSRGAGL